MMRFLELAKKRYSCRSFKEKEVEKEKIEKIIEAGLVAPTAKNSQPLKIWVVNGEAIKKFREASEIRFETPIYFVVGAKEEEAFVRASDGKNFAEVDASIVATHMMLEIEELDLATVWVGSFNVPNLKKAFPEMEGYELIAVFPVGYASEEASPSPRHLEYKAIDEFVEYLK